MYKLVNEAGRVLYLTREHEVRAMLRAQPPRELPQEPQTAPPISRKLFWLALRLLLIVLVVLGALIFFLLVGEERPARHPAPPPARGLEKLRWRDSD